MAPTPKEQKEWQVVYPVYLNSHRKRSEGRRIAASKGVENPTIAEIVEVCKSLGFQVLAEVIINLNNDIIQFIIILIWVSQKRMKKVIQKMSHKKEELEFN